MTLYGKNTALYDFQSTDSQANRIPVCKEIVLRVLLERKGKNETLFHIFLKPVAKIVVVRSKPAIFAANSLLVVFLKEAVIYLLMLVFLTQTFVGDITVLDYYLNTAAYAQNCVNKDKPMMHCNGRCQLVKKLQQQEKSDKQDQDGKSGAGKYNPLSSNASFYTSVLPSFAWVTTKRRPARSDARTIRMPRDFFHPPDACPL